MDGNDFALGYAMADGDKGCSGNGWGNGGFGDWIVIILFAMIFGWGGNGFGGFGGGNGAGYIASAATQADIQRGFDTQSIIGKLDGINSGICDGFYAVNTGLLNGFNGVQRDMCTGFSSVNAGINGVNTTLMQGFNAANVVALQNQNALQSQLAECLKKIFNKAKKIFCTDHFYAVGTCAA